MTLPTASSNDDKNLSSDEQLNLQLLTEVLPFANSDDTSHKQVPDALSSSASLPAVPRSLAEMQAISRNAFEPGVSLNFAELMAKKDMWLAWGRERRAATQKATDVGMVVNQGTKVKNEISGPPPTNDPGPPGKQHLWRPQSDSTSQVIGHQRLKGNRRNNGNLGQNQGHRKKIKNLPRKLQRLEKDKQQEVEQLNMEMRWAKFEKQRAEDDLRAIRR